MGLFEVLGKKGIIKGDNVEVANCIKTVVFEPQTVRRIMTKEGIKVITVPITKRDLDNG